MTETRPPVWSDRPGTEPPKAFPLWRPLFLFVMTFVLAATHQPGMAALVALLTVASFAIWAVRARQRRNWFTSPH